jgi:hypothetical protein
VTPCTLRATTALIPLLLLAAPAAGQNGSQPTIITPPVGDFDIGRRGASPTPSPTPASVTIQPIPTPPATATPVVRAPQARRATPTTTTSVPAPAPSAPTSGMSAITPATPPSPASGVPAGNESVAAPEGGSASPTWLWPALGGGFLLLIGILGGWLLGNRRRTRDRAEVAAAPPPAPVPVPPPTPGPPPLPRPAVPPAAPATPPAAPPPGTLVAELRPLRAAIRDGAILLDIELFVQNRGTESADNVRAVLALLGANAQQDEQIARFHAAARVAAGSEPFSIAPGGVHMLAGQVTLPGDQMPAVNVQGRPMFVPIVPVALRWYAGLSIRTLRDSFMIGTVPAPGSDRLGPLWVDRAAEGFGRLAAKRYTAKV